MRRDDALLTVANLFAAAFLLVAGPAMAIAAADPGGSHGNGGNSGSGKAGSGQGGNSRGNAGGGNSGNGGPAPRGNSGGNSSVSGQPNNGNSSKSNGNGNGRGNNAAAGAQSNNGSDGPATPPPAPNPPVPVVVADQYIGKAPAGGSWSSPTVAPPALELRAPSAASDEGVADLLSTDHSGIPVWAAAEPVELRGDLFGLAGLVLMPLVGLAVGYRQAKAVRDADLTIRP